MPKGKPYPSERQLDGHSIVPLLEGRPLASEHRLYYFKGGFLEAMREGKWKLHHTAPEGSGRTHADAIAAFLERTLKEGRTFTAAEVFGADAVPELYDLDADPSERFDLAAEHPEIVDRLRKQMAELARDMKPGPAFDIAKEDPKLTERRRIGRPGRERRDRPDAGGTPR